MSTDTAERWQAVAREAITQHKAVQKESELAALLELLATEVRPRTVLEIGSDLGGSLYAWGALPSVERVYAVTLPPPPGYTADYHGAEVLIADSQEFETVRQLRERSGRAIFDFVFIDGDHSAAASEQDLIHYGLASRFVALHDIVIHPQFPNCHVYKTWANFKRTLGPGGPRVQEIVHEPRTWGGFGLIRW